MLFQYFLSQIHFTLEEYRKSLTAWYNSSKRDLPWRESRDPYKIWVSEVILQQTRVQQGMAYYFDFLAHFPDIKSLALAHEEEVLKVWQGLGYYSRARNMHHAAKTILSQYNGKFPKEYDSIKSLKGIGDYTAAAIASICFNLPYAVVDGNVFRVLSRLFGIATPIDSPAWKKEFYKLAQLILDPAHPGESNQALMEFGAIQCLPAQPLCQECPLIAKCHAYSNKVVSELPVKSAKTKLRDRYFYYLSIRNNEKLYLEKRRKKDIWQNMYQFPVIETTHQITPEQLILSAEWKEIFENRDITIDSVSPEKIHLLSHQRLHISFVSVRLQNPDFADHLIEVEPVNVSKYPVPKPIENFLQEMGY